MGCDCWRRGDLFSAGPIGSVGCMDFLDQAARRAAGSSGERGWAPRGDEVGVVGGGEGVDGFGGGEGLLAEGCGFAARCGVEYGDAVGKGGGAGVAAGGGGAADAVGEGGEEQEAAGGEGVAPGAGECSCW